MDIPDGTSRRRCLLRLPSFGDFILYFMLFSAICVVIQIITGASASDHGQAGDEAAYFVSSLMIRSYIRGHLFSNPLDFAKLYYSHFPRVALGHYPPMFSGLQAVLFTIFGGTGAVASAFQALLGGLCAALPAVLVRRHMGAVAGLLAGIAVFCSPVFLFLICTDMADILLAILVTLTAMCWSRFYFERTWLPGIAFSMFAAASILTKGTALGLGLVPFIYLLYKKDLGFLLNRKTIVCGLLVGVCTAPWYVATYKMAAAGFNYSWGLSYMQVAIPFFLHGVISSVGILIAGLYALSLIIAAFGRRPSNDMDVHAFLAASLSMIIAPCVMPADISIRYLVPAIPGLVVTAVWGFSQLVAAGMSSRKVAPTALLAALVAASLAGVFRMSHVEPYRSGRLVSLVLRSGKKNPLVLVCGAATFEGAVISSFAEQDAAMSHFVVRGTEELAGSNFMGTVYAARFKTPAAMLDWIQKNEIGWIIAENSPEAEDFPHCRMLENLLLSASLHESLIGSVHSLRNGGENIALYQLPAVDTVPQASDRIFSELRPSVQF